VLLWLNILAVRKQGVAGILAEHWRDYGRTYYSRHDFEALETPKAQAMVNEVKLALPDLPGTGLAGLTVAAADDFAYADPVDGSVSKGQGLRIVFADGSRAVMRLSGTGTEGATLRLYLERHVDGPDGLDADPQAALSPVIAAAHDLAGLERHTGRVTPDVIT
jgi:phosphoglucomutase